MAGVGVRVEGLGHEYAMAAGPLRVLEGLDLGVEPGEHVAVSGPSGVGKTTLLAVIGGLEAPQRGRVRVRDVELAGLHGDGLAAYRQATVGFVFQDFGLLTSLTALENVELAMAFAPGRASSRRSRAQALLDAVGLGERADHRPAALSGGEAQRVAIARALANAPRLVLADEPTGNLDDGSTGRVLDLLETLSQERGCTLIVVTHDRAVAARADRRLVLADGRLEDARVIRTAR